MQLFMRDISVIDRQTLFFNLFLKFLFNWNMINSFQVYQVATLNIMNNCLILLALILGSAMAQIAPNPRITLMEATNSSAINETEQLLALMYVLQSHPELQNDLILNITKKTNQSNLSTINYVILLQSSTQTIEAFVVMSLDLTHFYVSYNVVLTSPPLSNSLSSNQTTTNNQSSPTTKISNKTANSTNGNNKTNISNSSGNPTPTPNNETQKIRQGGYLNLTNLSDSNFQKAIKYATSVHQNLINYFVAYAQYQIVAGVIYFIVLDGYDQFTKINLLVYINLSGVSKILEFKVLCSQVSANCSNYTASRIYFAGEIILKRHPELSQYTIESITINEQKGSKLVFESIYSEPKRKLNAIVDVSIVGNSTTIDSFYTYSS